MSVRRGRRRFTAHEGRRAGTDQWSCRRLLRCDQAAHLPRTRAPTTSWQARRLMLENRRGWRWSGTARSPASRPRRIPDLHRSTEGSGRADDRHPCHQQGGTSFVHAHRDAPVRSSADTPRWLKNAAPRSGPGEGHVKPGSRGSGPGSSRFSTIARHLGRPCAAVGRRCRARRPIGVFLGALLLDNEPSVPLTSNAPPQPITREMVEAVAAPILVTVGAETRPSRTLAASAVQRCAQRAELVVLPNTRRDATFRTPRAFNAAMTGFLRRHPPALVTAPDRRATRGSDRAGGDVPVKARVCRRARESRAGRAHARSRRLGAWRGGASCFRSRSSGWQ